MYLKLILYQITIILVQKCYSTIEENKRVVDSQNTTNQRIQQLEASVHQLTTEASSHQTILNTLARRLVQVEAGGCGGVIYVHWGKKLCPHNSTLVYSGFAGGSNSGHSGGSAEPLCMPRDPIMGDRAKPATFGYVYGAEYESTFFGPLSKNEDIPCAVCIAPDVSIKMMIPGRNKCYGEWKELYHGYLAGNIYTAPNTGDFVCMVDQPEFLFGGVANAAGRQFYGVISSCGSLKCPPYNQSSPLTCVLCTK